MMDEIDFERLIKPVIDTYNEIETDILGNIASKFDYADNITEKELNAWYYNKLEELGELTEENKAILTKYNPRLAKELEEISNYVAMNDINLKELDEAFEKGLILNDPREIIATQGFTNLIKEAIESGTRSMGIINTTALQSSNKAYMDILTEAYTKTVSGQSYNKSIRSALQQMADKGITGATYARKDGAIVNYTLEATVRRDTLTATHQLANNVTIKTIEDLGAKQVEVSSHFGARPSHAVWQGRVLNYPDEFMSVTQYGTVKGLGGANCRHDFFPFIKGVSEKNPRTFTSAENKKQYELEQTQRKLERDVRNWKKKQLVAEKAGDIEYVSKAKAKVAEKQKEVRSFVKSNNSLTRDYNREQIIK